MNKLSSLRAAVLAAMIAAIPLSGCQSESPAASGGALTLWEQGAPSRQRLEDFVTAAVTEGGPGYIRPADRVAVFDLDGTLFTETDPCYTDPYLMVQRTLRDPELSPRASKAVRQVARRTEAEWSGKGKHVPTAESMAANAASTAGMTYDEVRDWVRRYLDAAPGGYEGMVRGDAFYKPMLEVISYLQGHGFEIFVVTGSTRPTARGILAGKVDLPPRNVIGADPRVVATGQGKAKGVEYTPKPGERVVLGKEMATYNNGLNKVFSIATEIGKRPVLAFGNSVGDTSMFEYTLGGQGPALAFMVIHDDPERELGNPVDEGRMRELCAEHGFVPISMKDDWKTVFGPGVAIRQGQ
ncbi:MAG: haloacid dehalogenase-like hydrolase [Succinivibrionaceae bacterium]|nr:haloacid dehalogenase-like hydrolase [Succinivibrionaceae bacterium]